MLIIIPIILFLVTLIIANNVGTHEVLHLPGVSRDPLTGKLHHLVNGAESYKTYTHYVFQSLNFYYLCCMSLVLCGIFEYKLFDDKKEKDKDK